MNRFVVNPLSVFDHFVGLELEVTRGLMESLFLDLVGSSNRKIDQNTIT